MLAGLRKLLNDPNPSQVQPEMGKSQKQDTENGQTDVLVVMGDLRKNVVAIQDGGQ